MNQVPDLPVSRALFAGCGNLEIHWRPGSVGIISLITPDSHRKLLQMRMLQIQEFSLSTVVEYCRPVFFSEAKLDSVAKALALPPCGDFLNPADISLIKQNELFSYTMSVPLFGGAASVAINAQGITVSFKQGRTKEHLDLMIRLTARWCRSLA